jgi:uncharacterized membrane protein
MTLTNNWVFALWLVTALGCALVAGVFFAFSTFIMRALARLPPAQGMAAMQSIDITVITPLFMLALFGTGVTSIALTWSSWHHPNASFILASSLFYVLGTLGVTMTKNVPLNKALASANAISEAGAALWANYLVKWTFWNHVRTVAALVAAALLLFSISK